MDSVEQIHDDRAYRKTKVVVQDKTERKYPKSTITAYSDLLLEMPIIPHLALLLTLNGICVLLVVLKFVTE